MVFRKALYGAGLGVASLAALYAFQRPFRQFPGVEYENFEVPPDWNQPAEWAFARLMYPPGPNDGYAGRFDGDWREGLSLWTQDYPRADRHFSEALRRLTRIHVCSVEPTSRPARRAAGREGPVALTRLYERPGRATTPRRRPVPSHVVP